MVNERVRRLQVKRVWMKHESQNNSEKLNQPGNGDDHYDYRLQFNFEFKPYILLYLRHVVKYLE